MSRWSWASLLLPLLVLLRFANPAGFALDGDMQNDFMPMRSLLHHMVESGHLNLWNPYIFGGTPLAGNPQAEMFYPGALLFYVLPLTRSFPAFFLLHVSLASGFTYGLLRARGNCSPPAALTGALCYSLSGTMLVGFHQINQVAVAAWLMGATWAVERYRSSGQRSDLACAAVAIAMIWLAGFPQIALYSQLCLALYTLARVPRARLALALFLPVVWGFCLSAIQNLPFLELAARTVRAGIDRSSWCLVDSLPLSDSLQYLAPWSFHEAYGGDHCAYFGSLGLALAVLALRRRRPELLGWFALAALFFTLSLGVHSPLRALLPHLPLLNFFKAPWRLTFACTFCLTLLAGEGADELLRSLKRRVVPWLLAICVIELFVYQGTHLQTHPVSPDVLVEPAMFRQLQASAALPDRFTTLPGTHNRFANAGELWGCQSVLGVEAMPTNDWSTLMLVSQLGSHFPPQARQTMVQFSNAVPLQNLGSPILRMVNLGAAIRKVDGQVQMERVPGPLARAFLVHRWSELALADHADFLARPDFDPSREACVEGLAPLPDPGKVHDEVRLTHYESDEVRVQVNAGAAGLLILSDSWFPGWQASLNEIAAPIYRTDLALRGVRVPAGLSTVVFRYRPRSVELGFGLSALALAGLLLQWISSRKPS